MDNNAMFAAQQNAVYGKMYGSLDATGRRADELGAQSTINTRILELRKEKSRDAARSRRGKENYEFYELAKMLPLPGAITSQLDKASIIRLTIAYLRLRDFAAQGDPIWSKETSQQQRLKTANAFRSNASTMAAEDIFEEHEGTHILQSLDGFALSLNSDGRFLYVSETVSIYLGLSQVEMTGSSVFDYVHQSDHIELAEQLGVRLAHQQRLVSNEDKCDSNHNSGGSPAIPDVCYPVTSLMHAKTDRTTGKPSYDRAFCIRMKSTLTKRGCHFKSSGYRVVLLLGRLRPQFLHTSKKNPPPVTGYIGLAIALPPPSVHEVRLESDMFVTRLGFDFKIAHCEPKVAELLDYSCDDLTGASLYGLCHVEDVHIIRKTHEDLLNKGQVMSNYFRLLNKKGGYTWMQACATLIYNTKNSDEQSIICVNYVLSGPQYANILMDYCQILEEKIEPNSDCNRAFEDNKPNESKYEEKKRILSAKLINDQENNAGRSGNLSGLPLSNSTNRESWPFWRPPTLI